GRNIYGGLRRRALESPAFTGFSSPESTPGLLRYSRDQVVQVRRVLHWLPRGVLFAAAVAACCGGCGSGGDSSKPAPPSATCTAGPASATEQNSVTSISENVDSTCASVAG